MKIIYSQHSVKRMKQRGITYIEIEQVLKQPNYIKKTFEGRKEALGKVKNRTIKVEFINMENYIKIITVM